MKNRVTNISLSLLSLLLTFLVLETSARIYKSEFSFHNILESKQDLFRSAYPSEFDKELGWIPKKGNHLRNIWGTKVSILQDGIRSNGRKEPVENGEIILAVGDSFTFGDQVSDDETWPARLEEMSNTRVINGGVFGYGIDQSYLRMRSLASKYKPDVIIFSFIPDDIDRCELSERTSVPKPYFELARGGDLVLRKEHVQSFTPSFTPSEHSLGILRRVLGYSFFTHELMIRTFPEFWLQGSWNSTKIHSNGSDITCRIFETLENYAQEEKVELYILVQYAKDAFEKDIGVVDEVITCIDQDVLKLVDLRTSLGELKEVDIDKYDSLFDAHMTKEGNHFVASKLWDAITEPGPFLVETLQGS